MPTAKLIHQISILVTLQRPLKLYLSRGKFLSCHSSKWLPIMKTAIAMKTARKIRPGASAIYSVRNANDAASRVPNPLFSPLDNVAPTIREKPKGMLQYLLNDLAEIQKQNNVTEITLPTVNSITTTTVMTAHIAFCPIPLNNGSIRYSKETSVKAMPTLKE